MLDNWAEVLEIKEDTAIIVLDQSAAYDVIYHPLFIQKMRALKFDEPTISYFQQYLRQRRQAVAIDGFRYEELYLENLSVIQGSVLSCMLMLYVLDLPLIFTETKLSIDQEATSKDPKLSTFVDDTVTAVTLNNKTNKQSQINSTMNTLETYMNSNLLVLNREKSKFLLITKNHDLRDQLYLESAPKNIKPIRNFKFLGVQISDDFKVEFISH